MNEPKRVVIIDSDGDHLISEGFRASIYRGQIQVICGREQMIVCRGSYGYLRRQLRRLAQVFVDGGVFIPDAPRSSETPDPPE